MKANAMTLRIARLVLIILSSLGLLALALQALNWAPWLLSSVSWNA